MMDLSSIGDNQFLSGGIILGGIGMALALARSVPSKIGRYLKNRYVTTLEIDSNDMNFPWVQKWLSECKTKTRFNNFRTQLTFRDYKPESFNRDYDFNLRPSVGNIFLK